MKRGKRIVPNFQPYYVKVKHKFECHWEWKDNPDKTYEQDSLEYVIEHFKDKKNLVMLDVGAHIGYWSVQMSPYFSAIHSFECNHDLFPVLTYNTLKYDNIRLYPYGIDVSTEMLEFAYLPNHAEGCIGSYVIGKNEFHKLGELHQTKDVFKELIIDRMIQRSFQRPEPSFFVLLRFYSIERFVILFLVLICLFTLFHLISLCLPLKLIEVWSNQIYQVLLSFLAL